MEKNNMHNNQNHRYHPYQQRCEPQHQRQQQLQHHHHPTMANNFANQGDSESQFLAEHETFLSYQRQQQLQHHLSTMNYNLLNQGARETQFLLERETFLRRLPPGYKFCPTDAESLDYLKKKVNHLQLPIDIIPQVDVYKYSPQQLTGMYKLHRANAWYFFTARERKYRNGRRPSRSIGDSGFWKPTGTDNIIHDKDKNIVGYKRHLDYYEGKASKGEVKTDWKMHEYRLEKESDRPKNTGTGSSMQLDGLVLCKVYINSRRKKNDEEGDAEENNSVEDVGPVEEGGDDAEEYYSGADIVPVLEGALQPNISNPVNNALELSHTGARNCSPANSWLVGVVHPQCESRISHSARLEFSCGPVTDQVVNEGDMLPLPMNYQKHPLEFFSCGPVTDQVVNEGDMLPLPMNYQKHPATPRPLTVAREPDYATQQINRTEMETENNATLALPISSVLPTFPSGLSPNHAQGFQHNAQLGVAFNDLQGFKDVEEFYKLTNAEPAPQSLKKKPQ